MSRVLMPVGKNARTPYNFTRLGRFLYNVEELCLVITSNAFLITREDFGEELCTFLRDECGLTPLAEQLRKQYASGAAAAVMAQTVLEYVRYNPEEEIAETLKILHAGEGASDFERKLAGADYLRNNGRYHQAFEIYDTLMEQNPKMDRSIAAGIEHSRGEMYAKLFLFREAAGSFQREFDACGQQEAYLAYLYCMRMSMSNQEYVDFIGKNKQAYSYSMELERRMDEMKKLYDAGAENHMLRTMEIYRSEGNTQEYEKLLGRFLNQIREDYRSHILDPENVAAAVLVTEKGNG